ncbi:transcriptional regulator, IclR family [Nocardioides terrae]|uniref:Glycerol operon regulatory protein n=1 Tax=Nocardioides terrae TaxID=574651 RepID=A0A1I1KL69_9ACTN|nr:IclR family transcriptional regulator [Nocardioides terrae]SFC59408.1 transcriptional regulator, IclR family [Nocardioides terrae]
MTSSIDNDTTEPPITTGGVREVKSAARTVEILEFLAARQNKPVRLRELSEALGVPRSSLHALLRTLVTYGWVRADSSGTLYGIGIRALLAGTTYLDTDPYLPLVTPFLDELREQTDETFHLGRLDAQDVVYLATRESSQYLRPYSRVGRRLPAYATSLGKAILAAQPTDDFERHLPDTLSPLTPNTLTDRKALQADIEIVRERGYAVDNEENTLGLRCFAVALPYAHPATDAISASIPVARLSPEREQEIVAMLRNASDRITRVVAPLESRIAWS